MAGVIQYYVDTVHNPEAAIAFLEARARIDPKEVELIYTLAALHAEVGHKDDAIKYLTQAFATGNTNAMITAKIDPRFASLRDDPRFQALLGAPTATNAPEGNLPAANKPETNPPRAVLPTPAKK